jgi:hypothetical protein
VEHDVITTRPSLALAADLDLNPTGIPLALMLEYRGTAVHVADTQTQGSTNVAAFENLVALGVYYSGRTDLQLGVTAYTLFGQAPTLGANATPSGKPLDLAAQLAFRYFW